MHYFAHGLHIESELACPELAPFPENLTCPDVSIRYGEVPEMLDGPVARGVAYQVKRGQLLLKVDGVARYLILEGRAISVQPVPGGNADNIRLFLFGSAFGALPHQRGRLALHASAVDTGRGAVAFVGASGAGKSTVAAALHGRGYRVLADDVCAIDLDDQGTPQVYPGLHHLKLWADAARALDHDPSGMRRLSPQIDKYALALNEPFDLSPSPLCRVYLLDTTNAQEFRLEPLAEREKLEALVENTYRSCFLGGLGVRPTHFHLVTDIARHITARRVIRPRAPFLLAELVQRVEEDFGEKD